MNKGNQIIASFVLLLSMFALPAPVSAAATVSITDAEIASGENVTMLILIKEVTDLGVADIRLVYDQSVVNVIGVTNGDFDTLFPDINNVDGITRIGAMQMVNPGLNGSVVLANITLKAVGTWGCGTLNLGIIELKTIPGTNIPATVVNGTFCIVDTNTTTTTTTPATTTTTTTSTTTTTIGGGGGGGGGGAATSFEARMMDVQAGQAFDQDIDDADVPYLRGISLTLTDDTYSSKFSITDLDKKPGSDMADPDAGVYRYFKVSYDKKNYVESAVFEFRVPKSWLKENDISLDTVRMYRYTSVWDELPTEFLEGDDEWAYFKAETPGFSYFAITAKKDSGFVHVVKVAASAISEIESTGTGAIETELPEPDEPAITKAPPETPASTAPSREEKKGICGPTIVALLAAIPLYAYRRWKKN